MSEEQTNDSKWRQRELGALWKRQGRNQNYLTGTLRIGEFGVEKEVKIVIFTNKNKAKNERAPDFIVYESEAPQSNSAEKAPVATASEEVNEEVPDLLV
tara:strand:+ start:21610 stop:21906 length:297 start_codon:yes stop_codon:yes gene_type:complete